MKIHNYPSEAAEQRLASIAGRGAEFDPEQIARVSAILADVRKNGDAALIRHARQFDAPGMTPADLRVTEAEMAAARKAVDPAFLSAIDRAAGQIADFHRRQVGRSWIAMDRPGTLLGQMINPVGAAGAYVPGGKGGATPLVSSVLMTVIPARIAGVARVCMVTPPTPDKSVNPYLLAAAERAGAGEIYKMGSAWAIAALAYGTETVAPVDVIAGPGNIWVTLAKKLVAGTVGIDMIAGPSEILVIADETAVAEHVAADLLSQAEHDPLASAILVTPSADLAERVARSLSDQMARLARKETAAAAIADYGAILVTPDLDTAISIANRIAPEHLELIVADAIDYVGRIKNAGAVFVGPYTPEPVGDYMAGPNHVLPTGGTARFSSPLSVDHFMKKTSLIRYSETAFRAEAEAILRLAELEGLDAHANSVRVRLAETSGK